MLRRMHYVLLNYATRPMVWVLGGIYVVILSVMIFWSLQPPSNHRAYPEFPNQGPMVVVNTPRGFEDFDQGRFDTSAKTALIQWPKNSPGPAFSAKHLKILQSCPNLQFLTLFERKPLHIDEAQALGELQQLEALSLIGCDLPPELWSHLGRLTRLRHLDLSGCTLRGDYSDLESLAHLETLILGSVYGGIVEQDSRLLPEFRRLPRLKTLVLADDYPPQALRDGKLKGSSRLIAPSVNGDESFSGAIEHLRVLPALRTLYLNDQRLSHTGQGNRAALEGIARLQRGLPRLNVWPALIDGERQSLMIGMYVLNAVLFMLLAMQLQSQFAQPAGHLVPNYVEPHVGVVGGVWLFGILAQSIPLLVRDVPVDTALGLNLSFWGMVCGLGLIEPLGQTNPKLLRWIQIPLAILFIGIGVSSQFLLRANTSSMDWYLRGRNPGWTWLFIVCGIVASIAHLRLSLRMHSTCLERGVSSPPLGFDPAAMKEVYWRLNSTGKQPSRIGKLMDLQRERVIAQSSQPGWRRRSNLWIAGNFGNGNFTLLYAFVLAAIFAVVSWLTMDDEGRAAGFFAFQNPLILFLSIFLPDFPVVLLAGQWRQRQKLFATESLRSLSRTQFARQIATAIAWDMTPLAGVYLGILTWYVTQADPQRWSVAWTAAMFLVFVARWIVLYGLMLWAIAIRRNWVLVLTAAVAIYAVLIVNMVIIFLQAPVLGVKQLPTDIPDIGVLPLAGMALLFGLVACVVVHFAYRRWQRIELV